MDCFRDCLFPTASGKSEVGVELALRLNAEIVAMDSMTLYKRLDIGTAKPDADARRCVQHHLIDVLEPWEPASLDWYLREAQSACDQIRCRNKAPLFVGGTPLYLKACLRGIFDGPAADPELRAKFEQQAEQHGVAWLHGELAKVDPAAAAKIQPGDLRRIVRALEVYQLTGVPISHLRQQFATPSADPPPVACLTWPTDQLYDRINRRVVQMLEAGWIEEVAQLQREGIQLGRESSQAAGYKEILEHLGGTLDYPTMVQRIQTRTRQLSKRQRTWFRNMEECQLLPVCEADSLDAVVERVLRFFIESKAARNR
jgi:tRNA dimethylallyltransferase